jgi:hypothetical protein
MQVTQYFLSEKSLAVFGDYFPLDISGRKIDRSFSAQFLLTKSDVTFARKVMSLLVRQNERDIDTGRSCTVSAATPDDPFCEGPIWGDSRR